MPATVTFANNPFTIVNSGGGSAPSSGTSETWSVVSSALFPAAVTGVSQFHVADPVLPSELVAVTNVSGTTWTVTRGAESTTPVAHAAGFTVQQVVSAGWLGAVVTGYGGGGENYQATTVTSSPSTVNLASGNVQNLTLQTSVTLAFTGATSGRACSMSLYLTQDSSGSRAVTWPASVKWPSGIAPVLSTAANAVDLVILESFDGGTTWYGQLAGTNFH